MTDQDTRFLPFFLRQPIYVVPEPERPDSEPTPPPELSWQGEGKQEIMVLVQEPRYEFLAPEDQTFLEKILQAVSLTMGDVRILNINSVAPYLRQEISFDDLLAPYPYRTCVILGEVPTPWVQSSHFEKYRVTEGTHGQALLQADPLSIIASDTDKKGQLWRCLQQLFIAPR